MIKLKNGIEIPLVEDLDLYFNQVIGTVISESRRAINERFDEGIDVEVYQDHLITEIMDNCIYIAHQMMNIAAENENIGKFLITASLFNYAIIMIPEFENRLKALRSQHGTIH